MGRVVLELRCRRRPVLVWLRDAALASDALGFAAGEPSVNPSCRPPAAG